MYKLSDQEKEVLARRLHHYLQDHMYKNKVEKKDLAQTMGVDLAELESMLSQSGYQPLIEAAEVLITLASLKQKYGQPPGDLFDWIFAKKSNFQAEQKEIDDCDRRRGRPVEVAP